MSYPYADTLAKHHDTTEDRLLAAIERQNKRVAAREAKPSMYRGRSRNVVFSDYIPVIRRRREMKLIMRDPYRDNTTNIGNATQFNTVMRGSSILTI